MERQRDRTNVRTIVVSGMRAASRFVHRASVLNKQKPPGGTGDGLNLTASPLLERLDRDDGVVPAQTYVMEWSSFRYSVQRLSLSVNARDF
jgi:hypothetical protein